MFMRECVRIRVNISGTQFSCTTDKHIHVHHLQFFSCKPGKDIRVFYLNRQLLSHPAPDKTRVFIALDVQKVTFLRRQETLVLTADDILKAEK